MIRRGLFIALVGLALTAAAVSPELGTPAFARPLVFQRVSTDPGMRADGTHSTEVEPATLAWGRTIVAAFQVGRDPEGGAHEIGTATSTDAGVTWSNGLVPGTTQDVGGPFQRASDPSVAVAEGGDVWLVGFLGLSFTGVYHEPTRSAIEVSRSPDGIHFEQPVTVATAPRGIVYDKPWFGCDNQPASPYAGRCYAIWDAIGLRRGPYDIVYVAVSDDGGAHWGAPQRTDNHARGFGAVPVIEPDGAVVVIYLDTTSYPFGLDAFTSADGGATWSASTRISVPRRADLHGEIRDPGFPSVAQDASGQIFVVWSDCRFEPRCRSDHLVLSRSPDGRSWSHPSSVPLRVPSGTSMLTPALAVRTLGHRDELGIVFYAVSKGRVRIDVAASRDGNSGWGDPAPAGWMSQLRWFTLTRGGYFWGDYVTASFLTNGRLVAVVPLARRPGRLLDVAVYGLTGP